MGKGLNKFDDKGRRKMRRRNHIAHDLEKPQFRQKIKPGRPKKPAPEIDEWLDEGDIDEIGYGDEHINE